MKPAYSRPLLLLVFVFGLMMPASAQTSNGLHAIFKGTAAETKAAVQSNTLSFLVSGLVTDQQVQDFIKRSQPYAKGFTMSVTAAADKNFRQCKITFNGTPELKWLQRFFLASGIEDVELGGEKKNVSDFFKALQ